jgi:hypothetical protein
LFRECEGGWVVTGRGRVVPDEIGSVLDETGFEGIVQYRRGLVG